MGSRITIRLSDEEFQSLADEAKEKNIKISNVVKSKLFNSQVFQAQDLSDIASFLATILSKLSDIGEKQSVQSGLSSLIFKSMLRSQTALYYALPSELTIRVENGIPIKASRDEIFESAAKQAEAQLAKLGLTK